LHFDSGIGGGGVKMDLTGSIASFKIKDVEKEKAKMSVS